MARIGDTARTSLKSILEALLLASGEPLSLETLATVFTDEERPSNDEISKTLEALSDDYAERGLELKEVASGFRIQVREDANPWIARLWEERPQRYSRALLETLALIAYRQPITRGDIEEVRGVSVRTNIIRTLQEREWIRVVGHRASNRSWNLKTQKATAERLHKVMAAAGLGSRRALEKRIAEGKGARSR